jgi:hypothetical protein
MLSSMRSLLTLLLFFMLSGVMIPTVYAQATTTAATTGELVGFYLYNASSNRRVETPHVLVENGTIIDLAVVGTFLNIKAKKNNDLDGNGVPDHASSPPAYVVFDWDDQVGYSRDDHLPFTLRPPPTGNGDPVDDLSDIFPTVPELAIPGIHTIAATPFALDGTAGSTLQVTFEVVDSSRSSNSSVNNNIAQVGLEGELRKWHKITLRFTGPMTSETATPNPFTDYRLDVTFTHVGGGGKTYITPGFYAGDGDAANTHATSGNVWLVHFAPDLTGRWDWEASFLFGDNVSFDDDD